MNFDPSNDGIDHINIYSKGKTELGRFLTNFSNHPVSTPMGNFKSVEGYWYFLKTDCVADELRDANGIEAKKLGKELVEKYGAIDNFPTDDFKKSIIAAIKNKIESNPKFKTQLIQNDLPLAHYFYWGDEQRGFKVTNLPQHDWVVDGIEMIAASYKQEIFQSREFWSGTFIERLEDNQIFVFGSNPEGRHGAGAAKAAMSFGAEYGNGRGLQGQSYALPTKNLTKDFVEPSTGIKYHIEGLKSISEEQIRDNIIELYKTAKANPDKKFLFTFQYLCDLKGIPQASLNGYTSQEMMEIVADAGENIPANVIFHDSYRTRLANEFMMRKFDSPKYKIIQNNNEYDNVRHLVLNTKALYSTNSNDNEPLNYPLNKVESKINKVDQDHWLLSETAIIKRAMLQQVLSHKFEDPKIEKTKENVKAKKSQLSLF